jgi:hypothetical protein
MRKSNRVCVMGQRTKWGELCSALADLSFNGGLLWLTAQMPPVSNHLQFKGEGTEEHRRELRSNILTTCTSAPMTCTELRATNHCSFGPSSPFAVCRRRPLSAVGLPDDRRSATRSFTFCWAWIAEFANFSSLQDFRYKAAPGL